MAYQARRAGEQRQVLDGPLDTAGKRRGLFAPRPPEAPPAALMPVGAPPAAEVRAALSDVKPVAAPGGPPAWSPPPTAAPAVEPGRTSPLVAGWSLLILALSAVLMTATGLMSRTAAAALALAALPGLVGAALGPRRGRVATLAWAVLVAGAVAEGGGVAGPLTTLLLTPIFAAVVLGAGWRWGIGGAVFAAALALAAGALGWNAAADASLAPGLRALALVAAGVAAAVALARADRARPSTTGAVGAETDQSAARELEAFQELMGDLPDLAVSIDAEGRVEALFGHAPEGFDVAAAQHSLAEAVAESDRGALAASLSEAGATGRSSVAVAGGGEDAPRFRVTTARTSAGGLLALVRRSRSTGRNATSSAVEDLAPRLAEAEAARAVAEAARARAEAEIEGRSRFLAGLSHELRTPLNAIMGFADVMREKVFGALPGRYAEYADLIHESGRHLLDLIGDILDLSRIEAQRYVLSRERFDARDGVTDALRLVRQQADEAGLSLRAVLPPEPLPVDADRRAFKQIVLNLVSNALKFTPRGGSVTASLARSEADPALPVLELTVADTGRGIAPEDMARLGKPFEQAGEAHEREQGTGLGLSLVRGLAELHGGVLSLESRLGEGTAVTVRLPVLVSATGATEAAPPR